MYPIRGYVKGIDLGAGAGRNFEKNIADVTVFGYRTLTMPG